MLKTILLSILMTMIAVACSGPRYVDYFPYHDDGKPKPKVALMPIIDRSNSGLPWNVSEELSQGLYYELMNSGELYVMSQQECGPGWEKRESCDFFGNDLSFAQQFGNADFVVAMELIDHSTMSCTSRVSTGPECHPYNSVLCLRVRVRVIDLRCDTPRVALYEIVKGSVTVAPPNDQINYEVNCWGSKSYSVTPCATAHQRLICSLATKLEEVIWTAR